ncbi:UNVERIFIED_CONTAM: hypothetical protein K2H54_059162 [Gekko kuhli]
MWWHLAQQGEADGNARAEPAQDCEPEEVTDWSMEEKCSFCNLHKETVSDHTTVIGSLQSTPTEELSSQGQSNTDKIECQAENYLNALFRKKEKHQPGSRETSVT